MNRLHFTRQIAASSAAEQTEAVIQRNKVQSILVISTTVTHSETPENPLFCIWAGTVTLSGYDTTPPCLDPTHSDTVILYGDKLVVITGFPSAVNSE